MICSLIIVGARAMGRETCAYALDAGFRVKGFLDSDPSALDGFSGYPPILGGVEEYLSGFATQGIDSGYAFVVALGDPEIKMQYVRMIEANSCRFESVVHPSAYVGKNVSIGVGCILCPNCTVTNDTKIGDHVIVNVNASVSHDCIVEEGSIIGPGCTVAGRCKIGRECFLGAHSTLIPDIELGKNGDRVYVAAGAVCTKSFASGRIIGVPARPG